MGRAFDYDYWDFLMEFNRVEFILTGFTIKNPPTQDNTVIVILSDGFLLLNELDYERIINKISSKRLQIEQ